MASTSTIGTTTGGKEMKIIHLSTNKTAGKKTLWFDGGLHARLEHTIHTISLPLSHTHSAAAAADNTYIFDTDASYIQHCIQ